MSTTKGATCTVADTILCMFDWLIDNVNTQNQIPWDKCVAFSVDNTSVNMVKKLK